MPTKIINIKSGNKYDIYIGRENNGYNLKQSIFANPFIIGKHGNREFCILKYRLWINSKPELLKLLPSLKDKILACWCHPKNCHGDILIELSNCKHIKNWFSNMLPFDKPLIYQGLSFRTVENFYQAMKLPKNRLDLRKEISLMSPFESKKNIRDKIKYVWDSEWNKDKALKVMEYALEWKFQKGTSWHKKLMMTEDWELVEWNNWSDQFYGKDLITGNGFNHLGQILTKIRDKYNQNTCYSGQ